jgi:hypothetical protein
MKIESLNTLAEEHEKTNLRKGTVMGVKLYEPVVNDIFNRTSERGEQEGKSGYGWFLFGIKALKAFPSLKDQSAFLVNYYAAMRRVDDIADGDAPLPEGHRSRVDYVKSKIDFIEKGGTPKDEVDGLLDLSMRLGKLFQQDFHQESVDMLSSLEFDAQRYGTYQIFDEATLRQHFFLLDIQGGVKGSLKIFGEDPTLYEVIQPLGEAVRIYYNIRDFDKEAVKDGLINISREDCDRFNISLEEIKENYYENHPGVYAWFKEQAQKGLALIEEYRKRSAGVNFMPVTRVALKFAFETKTNSFLSEVAKGNFDLIPKRRV